MRVEVVWISAQVMMHATKLPRMWQHGLDKTALLTKTLWFADNAVAKNPRALSFPLRNGTLREQHRCHVPGKK